MHKDETEDTTMYKVVMNHEEQYSIWPADRENAPGWRDAGKSGNKAECLAYIKDVWTDMRPLSLRQAMQSRRPRPKAVRTNRVTHEHESSRTRDVSVGQGGTTP